MPTSKAWGKAWIDAIYVRLPDVARVLDVGVGRGTYSMRLRDARPGVEWIGVEAWEPYVDEFSLREKYDELLVADARTLDWDTLGRFDVVFMGDVLEHMTKGQAVALATRGLASGAVVLVSIPVLVTPQGAFGGNPYEVHVKADWSHEEALLSFPSVRAFYVERLNGVYVLAEDPERLRAAVTALPAEVVPRTAHAGWIERPRPAVWRVRLAARRAGRVIGRPLAAARRLI